MARSSIAGLAPFLVHGLAAASILVALPVAAAQPAPGRSAGPQGPFAGIPNVEIRYYDVSGRTERAIRESINARRPRDPNDGRPVDAVARWTMQWRWPARGAACDLARATVEFRATVLMPRLVDTGRVPAGLLARWRAYVAALETHEAGHVRYPFEHVGEVAAAIRSSRCANANDAARVAVAAIARHDVDYDRATRHGATQGATFP